MVKREEKWCKSTLKAEGIKLPCAVFANSGEFLQDIDTFGNMRIQRIIFLLDQHFSVRNYNRFGIEMLIRNNFKVEVWNLTGCLRPRHYNQVKIPDTVNFEGHRLFITKDEVKKAISGLTDDCFIVCHIDYNRRSYSIYRELSKKRIRYCWLMSNTLPADNADDMTLAAFLKKIRRLTPVRLINALFLRIPYGFLGLKPADVILAGGERSIMSYRYPASARSEILWLHTLDYDIYLQEKDNHFEADSKTAVFLDEYLPFHSDYLTEGIEPFVRAEAYYPALCRFFAFLEDRYGVNIVIAAHPRSNYKLYPDYFGGRQVIRGRTAELVKKSKFVIAHCSTSVNFCVLFKKPIIFVTTDGLAQSMEGRWIEMMAASLNKKVINIDNLSSVSLDEEFNLNEGAYSAYKRAYIKKDGSEEMPFWQLFSNYIKNKC